ncbi:RQC-minor-2 family DNA-binding protein [Metabacillus sp. 84]|uniref:RQC-minor-2 family DNA-binding protein n=1 Tax=unclassified Metabacillus TaxID=2675274 RepID=UPI003CFB4176
MSLQSHAQYFDSYPSLALLPLGKKNKEVRSAGHKQERALLNRIQESLDGLVLSEEEIQKLQHFLKLDRQAFFPVFLNRQERVHPHLMKPESFLWNDFSNAHGIPQTEEAFYKGNYPDMTKDNLHSHVKRVVRDFLFCADISMKSKEEWEQLIEQSYEQHPFVRFAKEKKGVTEAVERMNRSSLVSLLTPPEEVSYWRHRVEIVMRPYRNLPEPCSHEKEMQFDSENQMIIQLCELCKHKRLFHVKHSRVELEEEPDMDRAIKRIATIERQFNEIAVQNVQLLKDLEQISLWKHKLSGLLEAVVLKEPLMRFPIRPEVTATPFLLFSEQLLQADIPEGRQKSELIWLSQFELPAISMLKEVRSRSLEEAQEELDGLTAQLKKANAVEPFDPQDICIQVKNQRLTFGQVFHIMGELSRSLKEQPLHLAAQLLKGRTSYQVRDQELDQTPLYGYLKDWEEKDIQKAFKKLEKEGWIIKQPKGYEAIWQ